MKPKKYYIKKKKDNALTKKQKKAVTKIVKKEVSKEQEHKFSDTFSAVNVTSAAQHNYIITAIPQGTDKNQRIGNNVKIKYLNVRGTVDCRISAVDAQNMRNTTHRIMVIQHKQYNTTTTGPGGSAQIDPALVLLADPESGLPGVRSLRNTTHYEDINVLYDKVFVTDFYGPSKHYFNFDVPLKYAAKTIEYNASSDFLTNVTNAIFFYYVNDSPGGQASPPRLYMTTRAIYEDI